jgi:hypothetical protein
MIRGRRTIWYAGLSLIMLGIACLIISDEVATGWWPATWQAFGVGFVVGGTVDVLAIYGINYVLDEVEQDRKEGSCRHLAGSAHAA